MCDDPAVKRSRPIALLAAALLGFALLSLFERRDPGGEPVAAATPAAPQTHAISWTEQLSANDVELVFQVRTLTVTDEGWQVEVGLHNRTAVAWTVDLGVHAAFGLMLFANDDLAEVAQRNSKNTLPAVRRAREIVPLPPTTLAPGATWWGVIRAQGSLPAGRFVRVVFGPLTATDKAPEGFPDTVVWITDHAQVLEG